MPEPSNFHEQFDRAQQVNRSSNRAFGLVIAGAAVATGAVRLWLGDVSAVWWFFFAVPFLLTALLRPALLSPLNRVWLRLGLLLHRVVSPLILGLFFFLIIVPTGLIMRFFGKDSLRLKLEPHAASYWILRRPPGPAPET